MVVLWAAGVSPPIHISGVGVAGDMNAYLFVSWLLLDFRVL